MSTASTRTSLLARLGLRRGRRRRRPQGAPRRSASQPGSDPLWPKGVRLDPRCPSCGGRRTVAARDARGGRIAVPCPECAPNDSLGG